jgi:sortase (surface protein transpeptidase)
VRPRPTSSTTRQRRRLWAATLGLAGLALVSVAWAGAVRSTSAQLNTQSQLQRVLPAPRPVATIAKTAVRKRPRARRVWKQQPRPVHLYIPAIGASAPVIPLGLTRNGTVQTPANTTDTGWFMPGPEPGEKGAALIVGHVDSYRGPGVFYHLRALRKGDGITVVLRTHRKLRFVVTSTRQVLKVRFPTNLVFARTPYPTLRLVTCGGRFDSSTGHYIDNYIVFARLVGQP